MARLPLWNISSPSNGDVRSSATPYVGVELVLYAGVPSAAGSDVLSDDLALIPRADATSRMFQGCAVGPNGDIVTRLVLEVESDEAEGYPARWTNLDSEQLWDRRWRDACSAGRLGIGPRVLDVLPGVLSDEHAPRFSPLLYCREKDAIFPALCSVCARPLAVCRDDSFLEKLGLEPYSESKDRFLWCLNCAGQRVGGETRVYALSAEYFGGNSELTHVRGTPGLLEDLADLVRKRTEGLPCVGCEGETDCFPAERMRGAVDSRVTPLSFCDFAAIPYEEFDLSYGEFAALLGSAAKGDSSVPGRRFLFESDRAGRLPLEVLRLKLVLFRQVVELVARLHRETKRPHLALSSDNVAIKLLPLAPLLPSLNGFSARLIGLGVAEEARFGGVDFDLFRNRLDEFGNLAGAEHGVIVRIDSVERVDANTCRIATRLAAPELTAIRLRTHDVISVTVRQLRPIPLAFEIHGRFVARDGDEILMRAESVELAEQLAAQLGNFAGTIRGTARVARCRHVIDDLRELGYLWFETLVSNDVQSAGNVRRVVSILEDQIADRGGAEDVEGVAHAGLMGLQDNGPLARRNLFQNPGEWGDATNSVPEVFWQDSLKLGLRAVVQSPDFGICRSEDDFDPHHPEGPAEQLLSEISILAQKIETELLNLTSVRSVFARALQRVRTELEAGAGS